MKKLVYLAVFIIFMMALPQLVSAQRYGQRITVYDPASGEYGTCYKARVNATCVDYQPLYSQPQRRVRNNGYYDSTPNVNRRNAYRQRDLRTNQRYDEEDGDYEDVDEDQPDNVQQPVQQTQTVTTIRRYCTLGRGQYYGVLNAQCTYETEKTTIRVTQTDRNFNPNIVVRQTYWRY